METAQLVAVFLAWLVFAGIARAWHRWDKAHPDRSPITAKGAMSWVKRLIRGGPDPDPDPDPDPRRRKGYRLRPIDDHKTAVEWPEDPPPAEPVNEPVNGRSESRLDRWVAASLAKGARPADIREQGARLWGVSDTTIKRAIRRVRTQGSPDA